jgi:CubicO group peptidase (beta-lactamase class C family)
MADFRCLRLSAFGLALLFAGMLSVYSLSADSQSQSEDATRQMNEFVSSRDFSGVVLVARNGHVLFQKAYGMANREHDVPNTLETKFRVGSVTKQFTAMAVMILAERGKLNLKDPICKYVESCPKAWAPVTVRHLLNHTSGIPDFTEFPDNDHYERLPMTPLETMGRFRDKPLECQPGERFKYDSSGYLLLGYIIERASGEHYEDFVRKNIYEPLGMTNSGYDHPSTILKNRASGYERNDGQVVNAMIMQMDTPFAGGSMYSTVGDLLRWDQALYSEKLVSLQTLDQIFTPYRGPYIADEPWQREWYARQRYGYGWWITKWFGRDLLWHGGIIHGFCSAILRYPQDHTLVIVLENMEPDLSKTIDPVVDMDPMTIANGLSAVAFGLPSDTSPISSKASDTMQKR